MVRNGRGRNRIHRGRNPFVVEALCIVSSFLHFSSGQWVSICCVEGRKWRVDIDDLSVTDGW